ncbi:MAG: PIN domain-containing protein [Desulfurococcales archaeon]|nr:PIN domain-containing protein [Desulfurococcales archaeon]
MLTLVVDTNIVFSAIIKPGRIREILFRSSLDLYAPEELALELEILEPKILRYTKLSPAEVRMVRETILSHIVTIVPRKDYLESAKKAYTLLKDVDPKDAPFVGLAMFLGVPLWTGDKGIIELSVGTGFKHFVAVDAEGVEMLLEGKSLREVKGRMREKYGESVI